MPFQKPIVTYRTKTKHELYYRIDNLAAVKQRSNVTISSFHYIYKSYQTGHHIAWKEIESIDWIREQYKWLCKARNINPPVLLTATNLYRTITGQTLDIKAIFVQLTSRWTLLIVSTNIHEYVTFLHKESSISIRVSLITQIKYHFR